MIVRDSDFSDYIKENEARAKYLGLKLAGRLADGEYQGRNIHQEPVTWTITGATCVLTYVNTGETVSWTDPNPDTLWDLPLFQGDLEVTEIDDFTRLILDL